MAFGVFARLGVRQDSFSRSVGISVIVQALTAAVIFAFFFWLSRGLAVKGYWTADSMWSTTSWLVMVSCLQQHLKAGTTRRELEFLQHLPITSGQWLGLKLSQAIVPTSVLALGMLSIPIGWAVGSDHVSQLPILVVSFFAHFTAIIFLMLAAATFLSLDSSDSTRLFVTRMVIIVVVLFSMLFVLAAPKVISVIDLALGPLGYITGTRWFSLALSSPWPWSGLSFLIGLGVSGALMALSVRLQRMALRTALAAASAQDIVHKSRSTAHMRKAVKYATPEVAMVRKDVLTTLRSWKQQAPAVMIGLVPTIALVYGALNPETPSNPIDANAAYLLICLTTGVVSIGPAVLLSLKAIPDDYEALSMIRVHWDLRRFVLAKAVFASIFGVALGMPFAAALVFAFRNLPVSMAVIPIACTVSVLVAVCTGLFMASLRLLMGAHPRQREAISPFVTYLSAQVVATLIGLGASQWGPLGLLAVSCVAILLSFGLVLVAAEFLGEMDIRA